MEISAILLELYEAEEDNRYDQGAGKLFDAPVIAVAAASDEWFTRLKQVVGPHHWTPQEAIALAFPQATARSVICWSLPVSQWVRESNRAQKDIPSRPWAYARTHADGILLRITRGLEARLRQQGYATVGPAQAAAGASAVPPLMSTCWSQRHVAFVAGLGTFGISGGLITAHGVAHRLGSVVTELELAATPRPYGDDPFAWCLKSSRGACGACIARCPVGSIGQSVLERDKLACANQREMVLEKAPKAYGWQSNHYGCGLCQTAVPCEAQNPTQAP